MLVAEHWVSLWSHPDPFQNFCIYTPAYWDDYISLIIECLQIITDRFQISFIFTVCMVCTCAKQVTLMVGVNYILWEIGNH